jgi:hypothetical protein
MKSWSAFWLLAIALACFAPCGLAQSGSFAGSVTDSTGAEVPNTKITAVNVATGISRTAETDESGTYRITNLNPGVYDVQIEHPGFKSILFSHIPLSVDEVLTLDAHLVVSSAKETVTVTSEAVAPVDINDAQVGNLVDSRQMTDLPLILRDPYALILLSPGVIQSNTLFGGFSVNGSRERSNNFLMDGTDNNDPDFGGFPRGLSALNPETTQEFRVINNSYLPEFGRNSGAIIDIVTKHGTNEFHADAYWYGRYTALSAKDYFAADRRDDPFVRNQFGFTLGGPIQRNRTFFFVNGELQRFSTTILNSSIVPTQDFKTGVFTYTANGASVPIDVSTPTSPNNAWGLSLDPTMQQILALYPNPNGQILDGARGILHFPSHSLANGDSATGRIDHDFRGGGILALHYTYNEYSDNNYRHQDFLSGLGGVSTDQDNNNISLGLTSNFRQTMTNELRLGFNRLEFPLTCTGVSQFNASSPGGLDAVRNGMDFPLPASLSGFGCILLGDSSGSTRNSGTFTAGDSFSWVLSRHTIKIGGEFHDVYSNSSNNYASRTMMDFSVFSNFNVPAAVTGTAADMDPTLQNMVWMLLGGVDLQTQAQFFNAAGTRTATDAREFRQHEVAGFGQDSYKLFSNVTFTYGFRYEFFGVPTEAHNLLSTLTVPPDGPAPFTFVRVGDGPGEAPLYHSEWKNIEPRVAAAWDPFHDGKSSVRAGYGVYHDRIFGQLISQLRGDPPYQMLETQTCQGLLGFLGSLQSGTPNPQLLQLCSLSAQAPFSNFQSSPVVNNCQLGQPCSPILPFLVDPNLHTPYAQNWNIGIQHEFYPSLLFEVNYIGSKGTHLLRLVDGNPPQPALVGQLVSYCDSLTSPAAIQACLRTLQFSNLWLGLESGLPAFLAAGTDAANNNAFLQAELYKSIASSTYHALQMNITKRFSHGFAVQGAYTFSHAIDNASDPLVPGQGNQSFPRDSLSLGPERGNSDFDVRQRLVMNYSWQLPFGRGAKHWSEGVIGKVLEDWNFSGISTFSGGLPFDLFTNVDTQHTGFDARPDYNPSAKVTPSSTPRTQTGPLVGYFSVPTCDSCAGNLGRNVFRGPGINNTDFVVTKRVSFSERAKLSFRFEFYNLFNRVQFNQPDNQIADGPAFGQSTSEYVRPDFTTGARQVQLAMRLTF